MFKSTRFTVLLLILSALLILSCAPAVSTEEHTALKAELAEANQQLSETEAELAETRTALDKAHDELAKAQATLDAALGDLAEVQTACLEVLLSKRRSIRDYADTPLTKEEVMKLLWAGQGITAPRGGRTAPSAGRFYPLRVYLVVGNVENLSPGIYKYQPDRDKLTHVKDADVRADLAAAAYDQRWVEDGAINIVIAAVYEETMGKYGGKAVRFVHLEAGHAAQNICLEATALGLGLVTVGGFDDADVADIVGLTDEENPLYIIPVGRRQ